VKTNTADSTAGILRRVLVIDDSEVDAELLEVRLREQYPNLSEYKWLREPAGLIDKVASFRPDLVITDHHMPGYDVIASVSEMRRRWPTLPVLVMSGLVGEEAATRVLKAGANDFLPKSRSERLPLVIDRELAEARAAEVRASLQSALERQRRINQAIFDQAPTGMWMLSAQGQVIQSNRQGDRMLANLSAADRASFLAAPQWLEPAKQVAEAGDSKAAPRPFRVRALAGEDRHFSCDAALLTAEDGTSIGVVVTATDVTDEVLLRERLLLAQNRLRNLSINQTAWHERQLATVSRELHDNLGQVLSLLKLHLGTATRTDMPEVRRQLELDEALPLVDIALSRLREVCGAMRPSELSDFGLVPALRSMCAAAARASGVDAALSHELADEALFAQLDPALQTALFRVAQQALTNALRHAQASVVRLVLSHQGGTVELRVTDNGCGFNPDQPLQPSQQGLRGMRERMELLGGRFELSSLPEHGTTIRASVPVDATRGAS
jgi:two-component system sensor histidine kinase UhpB